MCSISLYGLTNDISGHRPLTVSLNLNCHWLVCEICKLEVKSNKMMTTIIVRSLFMTIFDVFHINHTHFEIHIFLLFLVISITILTKSFGYIKMSIYR
jgi:hypothetical protein